jgi:hypothetical protein
VVWKLLQPNGFAVRARNVPSGGGEKKERTTRQRRHGLRRTANGDKFEPPSPVLPPSPSEKGSEGIPRIGRRTSSSFTLFSVEATKKKKKRASSSLIRVSQASQSTSMSRVHLSPGALVSASGLTSAAAPTISPRSRTGAGPRSSRGLASAGPVHELTDVVDSGGGQSVPSKTPEIRQITQALVPGDHIAPHPIPARMPPLTPAGYCFATRPAGEWRTSLVSDNPSSAILSGHRRHTTPVSLF